ncbi:hypothetical protein EVAR_81986_1 [Eumeta japonica]|uniref:Uncharacterized protein n=1 Tax=Eumeta variegata TaxID=151549 RepID=A0A4C1VTP8_EUMVA|nr:hypothetical protein EVAR_81986_1 [Eumeta japonica]
MSLYEHHLGKKPSKNNFAKETITIELAVSEKNTLEFVLKIHDIPTLQQLKIVRHAASPELSAKRGACGR